LTNFNNNKFNNYFEAKSNNIENENQSDTASEKSNKDCNEENKKDKKKKKKKLKNKKIELRDIEYCSNVSEIIKDRSYNKSLQELVSKMGQKCENLIFKKIQNQILELCEHQFANYILQKMVDFLSEHSIKIFYLSVSNFYLIFYYRFVIKLAV
jgi:hypothetical protein